MKRHEVYIEALRARGVHTLVGQFKRKTLKYRRCKKIYAGWEEKEIDVNIATRMFATRLLSKIAKDAGTRNDESEVLDRVTLVSNDSDLLVPVLALVGCLHRGIVITSIGHRDRPDRAS